MPRLFPSLHRSREHAREDYTRYNEYGHYNPHPPQHTPAWRRVLPTKKTREGSRWPEEVVEYPESYNGHGDYRRRQPQAPDHPYGFHPAENFGRHSESTLAHTEDAYDTHYSHDNAIPIVQRESSLTRLQEAFADHETQPRPVTQVNLPPQGTPRHSPHDFPPPPPPELRNVYPSQQPVLVQNTRVDSVEADVRVRSRSHRAQEKRPDTGRREREETFRRDPSIGARSLDEDDYPPCVVVVERGRNGKQDTYYVIPGGAPVIFEDDEGKELTRVGDFSGRYRPRRQRPVIIEDENGNEVGRLGFDDETSLDYPYRNGSDDSLHERGGKYGHSHRYRDEHDRHSGSSRSHTSPKYTERYTEPERDYHRTESRTSRGRSSSSKSPNVVYIPYVDKHPSRGSSRTSHQSGRSSRREYEQPRSYDNVIELDHYGREVRGSGSISSGSSGRRSYGSSHRRRDS